MFPSQNTSESSHIESRGAMEKQDDVYNWQMSYEAWQTFNDLRQKGLFYDVSLVSDEEKSFLAHKVVLCTCGRYFKSLFSGRWKSSKQEEIIVTGVKAAILDKVVQFAYTRRVELSSISEAKDLLVAGGHFGIEEILKACANYLISEMKPNNSLDLWSFSRMYYCKELESKVFSFILDEFEIIARTPEISNGKAIHHLNGKDLAEILESDALNTKSERLPLCIVLRWAKHATSVQQRHYMFRLLSSVRMGFLTTSVLTECLERYGCLLSISKDARSLIEHHIALSNMRETLAKGDSPEVVMTTKGNRNGFPKCDFHPAMCDVLRKSSKSRYPHEVLLVVGGWSGNAPIASSEAYNPITRKWNNTKAVFPLCLKKPRAYHGVCFLGGHIFVVGGFDGQTTYNSCDRYSLTTKVWKKMCGMHHRRCYVGVTQLDDHIYAVGGSDGDGQMTRLNTAEKFDPNLNSWSRLPDMTERRSDAGVCGMAKRLYVAGGFTGQRCVSSVEYFDLFTYQWCRISPMRIRRSGVTIIMYKESLLALGGFDGVSSRLDSVESYNPNTDRWTTLPNMLTGRSNFSACILREKLIVMGGFNGSTTCNNVEYFDEKGWDEEDLDISLEDIDDAAMKEKEILRCTTSPHDEIEEVSGDIFYDSRGSSQWERSNLSANHSAPYGVWKQLPHMNMSRSALSCCVLKDLPSEFLRTVVMPSEFSGCDNAFQESDLSCDLDKLLPLCMSMHAKDVWNSRQNAKPCALQKPNGELISQHR